MVGCQAPRRPARHAHHPVARGGPLPRGNRHDRPSPAPPDLPDRRSARGHRAHDPDLRFVGDFLVGRSGGDPHALLRPHSRQGRLGPLPLLRGHPQGLGHPDPARARRHLLRTRLFLSHASGHRRLVEVRPRMARPRRSRVRPDLGGVLGLHDDRPAPHRRSAHPTNHGLLLCGRRLDHRGHRRLGRALPRAPRAPAAALHRIDRRQDRRRRPHQARDPSSSDDGGRLPRPLPQHDAHPGGAVLRGAAGIRAEDQASRMPPTSYEPRWRQSPATASCTRWEEFPPRGPRR